MSKIEIGKIVNTHGLRGCLKVQPWTDYPEVFEEIQTVFLNGNQHTIQSVSYQKNSILLVLSEIDTVEKAAKLKNTVLLCEREALGDLPQQTYYIVDLIGCKVYEDETELGILSDVIATGGADLYEIQRNDDKPLYLPAVKENILCIDIPTKTIHVKLPEGLLDL